MKGEMRLDDLRVEIDDVDDRIHDLLMRRAEIASMVGESKRKQAGDGTPRLFRPAREARVLRRLLARHHGPLPRAVVQDVWRAIIAGNLLLQGKMIVAATSGVSARLARDHFGSCVGLQEAPAAGAALDAVSQGRAAVAVLPFPGCPASNGSAWWPALAEHPGLHIVGQIPVFRSASSPTAALVAEQAPEPSDVDVTLVLASAATLPSGDDAPAVLATATRGEGTLRFVALDGYVSAVPRWAGPEARIAGVVAAALT